MIKCTIPALMLRLSLPLLLAGCSDGSDRVGHESPPAPAQPSYEFTAADSRMQRFLDESATFDGISYTIVDKTQGTVHEAAFGDHTLDTVVMLASTSKVPVASLLMALDDDPSLDFDVTRPVGDYLPWEGVYGDRSTEQLLSNTSGIPGLGSLGVYGPHLCQYSPGGTLEDCARTIYSTELEGTVAAGSTWDYGGSQWQLAGAVAEQVSNSTWAQAFDAYIGEPCALDVFRFGNMWSDLNAWNGSPDSLRGLDNPNIEGGGISNLQDYAKLLQMHLNGGQCGDTQVMDQDSVRFMQADRGGEFGVPYGLGWWIVDPEDEGEEPSVFYDPGAFGAVSWIDTERNIGGFVAIDDYSRSDSGAPVQLVLEEIISLVAQAVDDARAAVAD